MNKTDFVTAVSKKADLGWDATKKVLDAFTETIQETLSERGEVRLPGFGCFETTKSSERKGRNPATGAEITIAAKVQPKFRPAEGLKEACNKK